MFIDNSPQFLYFFTFFTIKRRNKNKMVSISNTLQRYITQVSDLDFKPFEHTL